MIYFEKDFNLCLPQHPYQLTRVKIHSPVTAAVKVGGRAVSQFSCSYPGGDFSLSFLYHTGFHPTSGKTLYWLALLSSGRRVVNSVILEFLINRPAKLQG